jgi:hypothetical protein
MVEPRDIHIPIEIVCHSDEPRILMPPDAFGDREKLTVQEALLLLIALMDHHPVCSGPTCLACELYETLQGIR